MHSAAAAGSSRAATSRSPTLVRSSRSARSSWASSPLSSHLFALAKIGSGAARRYFVTGERFGADVALRIGLVHEVDEDLDVAVERVVGELLSAGPNAARAAKELARAPLSRPRHRGTHRCAPHER